MSQKAVYKFETSYCNSLNPVIQSKVLLAHHYVDSDIFPRIIGNLVEELQISKRKIYFLTQIRAAIVEELQIIKHKIYFFGPNQSCHCLTPETARNPEA